MTPMESRLSDSSNPEALEAAAAEAEAAARWSDRVVSDMRLNGDDTGAALETWRAFMSRKRAAYLREFAATIRRGRLMNKEAANTNDDDDEDTIPMSRVEVDAALLKAKETEPVTKRDIRRSK